MQESLEGRQLDIRNLEKEIEQYKLDVKSLQMRFDREKTKSE